MRTTYLLALLLMLIIAGCTSTSAVMLEGGVNYPPTKNVQILTQPPTRPFKQIAILETSGDVGTPMTDLLKNMRQKAANIGADAVIPTKNVSRQTKTGVIYNPWLGGYQTIGGGTFPAIQGIAIKYTD
jgi:hypothetical protein